MPDCNASRRLSEEPKSNSHLNTSELDICSIFEWMLLFISIFSLSITFVDLRLTIKFSVVFDCEKYLRDKAYEKTLCFEGVQLSSKYAVCFLVLNYHFVCTDILSGANSNRALSLRTMTIPMRWWCSCMQIQPTLHFHT